MTSSLYYLRMHVTEILLHNVKNLQRVILLLSHHVQIGHNHLKPTSYFYTRFLTPYKQPKRAYANFSANADSSAVTESLCLSENFAADTSDDYHKIKNYDK